MGVGEQQPWGIDEDSPMNEGSDDAGTPPGRVGERRAGEATGRDAAGGGSDGDELPWGEAEAAQPGTADWTGQPNLEPDPPVAGRPTRLSPGSSGENPTAPGDGAES